jgi:hypothetical protein
VGGSDRSCAFDADGAFTPDNWNCGTIEALMALGLEPDGDSIYATDETMQIIRVSEAVEFPEPPDWNPDHFEQAGWIVLTRYKRRGKTTSAMHVGDFWPARPLTLQVAESVLALPLRSRS